MNCPLCKSSLYLNHIHHGSLRKQFVCKNCYRFIFVFVNDEPSVGSFISESNKYRLCIFFNMKLSIIYDHDNDKDRQLILINYVCLLDTEKNLDSQIEDLLLLS